MLSSSAWSIDLGPGEPCAAFKLGRFGSGTLVVSDVLNGDHETHTAPAWTTGVEFDFPLSQRLYAGAALDIHMMEEPYIQEIDLHGGGLSTVELGVQLKGLINFGGDRFALRPGIGVGGGQGKYSLLAFRAVMEFQASMTDQFGVGLETGVWYAPVGTDNRTDIRIGPAAFLRGEVLFSVRGKTKK